MPSSSAQSIVPMSIGRFAEENHLWGAQIHGELLNLGIVVSERTVSRYLAGREPIRAASRKPYRLASMVEITGTKRRIVIAVLRVLLGLAFLTIGIAKLTGTLSTVQTFEAFGFGQWLRYFTGLLDLAGALLVLVRRWTCFGALLITCTVGLGAVFSWPRPSDFWAGLSLALLAATLTWLTWPRRVRSAVDST
jgi:putative oxidoreductase